MYPSVAKVMTISFNNIFRLVKYSPWLALGMRGTAGLLLSRRCDMACPYCSIRSNSSHELPAEEWLAIIDNLFLLKVRHAVLTGGEPTLHKGIVQIAEHAKKKMLVSLVSNGNFIIRDQSLARSLLSHIDLVSISSDAFIKNNNHLNIEDIETIENLLDSMKKNREMIITITNKNIENIPEITGILCKRKWSIRFSLVHQGLPAQPFRGKGSEFAPGSDQASALESMAESVETLRGKGLPVADSPEFIAGMSRFVRGEQTMKCAAGIRVIEVDADGTVQPCQDSPSTGITTGKLLEMTDPDAFLRRNRQPSCRCHYSHYFRLDSSGKKLNHIFFRLKAINPM
jgi:MoaA/NifB/PqqE/SkfB family radical SAM enzyme